MFPRDTLAGISDLDDGFTFPPVAFVASSGRSDYVAFSPQAGANGVGRFGIIFDDQNLRSFEGSIATPAPFSESPILNKN